VDLDEEQRKVKEYRKDDWISSKVEIRASPVHGKGMFAVAPIEQSEVVAVWGGRFVNRVEADLARLAGKAVQQIEEDVFEVFDYDKRGEDPTYYHNHSCDPNTWMRDEVTIIARRRHSTRRGTHDRLPQFLKPTRTTLCHGNAGATLLVAANRSLGRTGDYQKFKNTTGTTFPR
jgi:hypothetical protein